MTKQSPVSVQNIKQKLYSCPILWTLQGRYLIWI